MSEQGGRTMRVMRDNREVVGCVALRRLEDRAWSLAVLAVDPDQPA
jgi:hypothetical protein